ncbi:MAG TPA: flagellar hook capping FlgD N-terminal domain-containing protein [Burkholderiales bacterium]|nr:flagellar hook capping FlgD N-terminal domain-containing protein [Burkholderiales bacterium]
MAVESIGATSLTTSTPANAVVGQDDFLKILLTQLKFQDPLKPIDNQEFIAQLAQFSSLEFTRQQGEEIKALLTIQSASQSLSLMSRTVEVAADGANQVGTVTAIRFQNGEPLLTIKTSAGQFLTDVRLSQVTLVNNS